MPVKAAAAAVPANTFLVAEVVCFEWRPMKKDSFRGVYTVMTTAARAVVKPRPPARAVLQEILTFCND